MKNKYIWTAIAIIFAICILVLFSDAINLFGCIGIPVKNFNGISVSAVVSIIASVISGALTLIGVYLTIEDNKKEKFTETKRLIMPMLKITEEIYDYKCKYIQFDFHFTEESKFRNRKNIPDTENITINIKNVGQRELYDFYLGEFESTYFYEGNQSYSLHSIIYAGDSVNINFGLYENGVYGLDSREGTFDSYISPISFSCLFKDCLGTCYKQRFTITILHQLTEGLELNQKALNASIDRIIIDTAPQEISEDIYNGITENAVQCGGQ